MALSPVTDSCGLEIFGIKSIQLLTPQHSLVTSVNFWKMITVEIVFDKM